MLQPPSPASSMLSPNTMMLSTTLFFLSFLTNKDDDELVQGLVLPLLEHELHNHSWDGGHLAEDGRRVVHGCKDLSKLLWVHDKDLWPGILVKYLCVGWVSVGAHVPLLAMVIMPIVFSGFKSILAPVKAKKKDAAGIVACNKKNLAIEM